jgi:hypothetical protein
VLLEKLAHADIGLAPLLPELHPFSGGKSFGTVLAYVNAGPAGGGRVRCRRPRAVL